MGKYCKKEFVKPVLCRHSWQQEQPHSIHNIPMIPFYLFYSMFGFQRVGDLIWACGDILCKGFLLGGTAGRTTLNGEGLQHQDGHSHVIAETVPNLKVMIQHLITS